MKRIICFFIGHIAWKVDVDGPPVLSFTDDARSTTFEFYVCDRCHSFYGLRKALAPVGKPP